jgi:hypothetical protein
MTLLALRAKTKAPERVPREEVRVWGEVENRKFDVRLGSARRCRIRKVPLSRP